MGWAVRALKARGGIQQSRHMGASRFSRTMPSWSARRSSTRSSPASTRRAGLLGRPVPSPAERDQHNDGGRSVYWDDPNGSILEIITRPYGSGGQARPASHSGGGRPIGSHISTTLTRAPAATLRDQNVGAEVVDVKEFELAIGHLRMPETD